MEPARIVAVCSSADKGQKKQNIHQGMLIAGHGLKYDAHNRDGHRQLSLLSLESIAQMQEAGLDVGPGDFAENLTTQGICLSALPIGTRLQIGDDAIVEITQIGKTCHNRCAIYHQAGDCVMPREGIFAVVLSTGAVAEGDPVQIIPRPPAS